jgi:homoserine kinase
VRVPCSTSNLGAGFDCVGLALGCYLHASYEPGREPLALQREGTLAGLDTPAERDHTVVAFQARSEQRGGPATGLIRVRSEIPVGRGLGSSAAALVAGFVLADAAAGRAVDASASFAFAESVDGHPDNAAPCAFGGLVACAPGEKGTVPIRLPLSDAIAFVYAAPAVHVSTERARNAMPRNVELTAVVESIRRTAALLAGLATGSPELLAIGFADALHVPVRLPLIPGAAAAIAAAREAGAWAVTISGSGSGLIAVAPHEAAQRVAESMRAVLATAVATHGMTALGFPVSPDPYGAQILDP